MCDNVLYHTLEGTLVMDWPSVAEVVKVLGSVATAGAAWFAAVIAYRGLSKWRAETIGKRKAELAEDVIADFYEARDMITTARLPGSLGGEGDTRQKSSGEGADETRYFNAVWVTVERLRKEQEFFAQLEARRYRFIAYFGSAAAGPYDELRAIHGEMLVAVRMLIETYRMYDWPEREAERRKWETTIGWHSAEDDIPRRLDAMVAAIETTCRPAIQEATT
jgi:hypothetical protein